MVIRTVVFHLFWIFLPGCLNPVVACLHEVSLPVHLSYNVSSTFVEPLSYPASLPLKKKKEKNNPALLLPNIEKQQQEILAMQERLKGKYGTTMDKFMEKQDELASIEAVTGKNSRAYKTAMKELDEIRESEEDFEHDSREYLEELSSLDAMVDKLSHEVKSDFQEDYYQKYQNYAANRPPVREIRLNQRFWSAVLNDPKDVLVAQGLVDLSRMLYAFSIPYTDAYFNNAQEKAYLEKRQASWEQQRMQLIRNGVSREEIGVVYQKESEEILKDPEYQRIIADKERNKEQYLEKLEETIAVELTTTLSRMLNTQGLILGGRPASIPQETWYAWIIEEGAKVANVLQMTGKAFQGTGLIVRQAVKSGVVDLQLKNAGKKSQAFIMENENIELIVVSDGKNQRYELIDKTATARKESLGANLLEKNESLKAAYQDQKYRDIRNGVARERTRELASFKDE